MARKKNDSPPRKPKPESKPILKLDKAAVDKVQPWRETAPVRALSWFSELGDQPQMIALSGGVMAVGLARRDGRMAGAGARMLAAHMIATLAKNFVKRRIDRTRPRSAQGERGHEPELGRTETKEETSFPSGHSAGAVAVARAFARVYPEHSAAAHGTAGVIALAQIPRCAHYPTDVGAGVAIGLAAEAVVNRLWSVPAPEADPESLLDRFEREGS